jgi:hypothetical protein
MGKHLVIGLLSFLPFLAEAQSFYAIRRPRNLTIYGGTGTALYKGELVNPQELGKIRYNLLVGSEYIFSQRFTVKGELVWFNIAGSDKNANDDRTERNLSFTSNNQELSVHATVHLLKEPKQFYKRSMFNLYAFAGIGLLHINPKAEYNGKKYPLQPLQTENVHYSRFQASIPYGFGVRIKINPLYNLIFEGGYRTTFTDYLDDISSRRYVDPATLKGGATGLSAKLADRRRELDLDYPIKPGLGVRGNPKENDGYFLFNVKIQYYLKYEIGPNREANKFYRKKRKNYNPKRH